MDKVVHFEIPAVDMERAKKFYKHCFSWDINSYPEMKYTILRTGPADEKGMPKEVGFISGGMFEKKDMGVINHPVITISVKDMNKSIDEVQKAGGKLVKEPFEVKDMGFAAYFEDTEGNILGLWEDIKHAPKTI